MTKYLEDQIITYMGNKRKIVPVLSDIIDEIIEKIPSKNISSADAFSGSGIVSRLLKTKSSTLFVNDISGYSNTLNKCYLANTTKREYKVICNLIQKANDYAHNPNNISIDWIFKHWASPRMYFTEENAKRIDKYRYFIDTHVPQKYKSYILAPLLVKSSIHNNTNGQFAAYHKGVNGLGQYGGKNSIDLQRITRPIILDNPIMHQNKCRINVSQKDVTQWLETLPNNIDIMYIDPPYNKHSYATYYFMLDIINNWNLDDSIPDTYRGQPKNWTRSLYNSLKYAEPAFQKLIQKIQAKYIIVSYNNKGIIPIENMVKILSNKGTLTTYTLDHKTYNRMKGIANYKRKKKIDESNKTIEYIWVVHNNTE